MQRAQRAYKICIRKVSRLEVYHTGTPEIITYNNLLSTKNISLFN